MITITRIALDFAEFYGIGQRLVHLCGTLSDDRALERAMAVIGAAVRIVIGATL